jgi:uncharacterized protein YbaP (TraB family)
MTALLGIATPLPAAQPAASAAASASDSPSGEARGTGGLLYRATSGTRTVFLYGTVHVGNASFYPLAQKTLRPLHRSEVLAVEVDLLDPGLDEAFRRHGTLPAAVPAVSIPPEHNAMVDMLLRKGNIDPAFGRRIKPDVLVSVLSSLAAQELGYTSDYSVESFLIGFARASNIKVVELEGLPRQLSMNDTMSGDERHALLVHSLRSIADGAAQKTIANVVEGWRHNDIERLLKVAASDAATEYSQNLRRQMVQRNRAMADSVAALSAAHNRVFVAVGVLHFVGEANLPDELAKAGFRIERLL